MLPEINKIKGIHPGIILKREIARRGLKNKELAMMVNEHAQTISAILKGKRSINPRLSVKLGKKMAVDPAYFMMLQTLYDVKKEYEELTDKPTPNLEKIRKVLFWDTDFNRIDWIKNKRAIIKRIFERGNDKEISEIIQFYSQEAVKQELDKIRNSHLPSFKKNVDKYNTQ